MRIAYTARMKHLKALLSAFSDGFFLFHAAFIRSASPFPLSGYFAHPNWNHSVSRLYEYSAMNNIPSLAAIMTTAIGQNEGVYAFKRLNPYRRTLFART